MGKFYLCTELNCNRKYVTKSKLLKHLLDAHEIIKSENEITEPVEITKDNKKDIEANKNKTKQNELVEERLKEINRKKQLELDAKAEAERELKEKYLAQYKKIEQSKLELERKQIELDKKWLDIIAKVQERLKENSSECSLCVEEPADTACVPCGHKNFCRECIENYLKSYRSNGCPVCRQKIDSLIKIYS
ncbi:putative E3 ubiquitin-protein ligase XBAT35-like [Tupanvirus deep ocean]|uniref:E3 ubiquitin-protein ligase XBAT35-like n=2 Tax=Tupanvirus TaxID=2094720 RepID=A0AC62A9E0_9VIRU|nr:putative E3 ubiquitin-protein ligase XBAT35-like [Tupanvirus deep ocean]QKU34401.1 putative E3 ubiquitin-protein ligase XBAT35-like [Tupanvirus deep ocean]